MTAERPQAQEERTLPRKLQDPSSLASSSGCTPQASHRTRAGSGSSPQAASTPGVRDRRALTARAGQLPEEGCTADSQQKEEDCPGAPAAASRFGHRRSRAKRGEPASRGGPCSPPHFANRGHRTGPPATVGSRGARAQPVCSQCERDMPSAPQGSPRTLVPCPQAGAVGLLPTPEG